MAKITPCLWYNYNAEEAAKFYVTLLPDSRIDEIVLSPADNPSTPKGAVLLVKFTLGGQPFIGLNGGPLFKFTEAVSFTIDCDDQAEVDRLWESLLSDGGKPKPCGWLEDRFGLSWQIVPKILPQLMSDPKDPARAQRVMQAMLEMEKLDIAKLSAA